MNDNKKKKDIVITENQVNKLVDGLKNIVKETYNTYAVCHASTKGDDKKYEKCVKDLKGKKGYKLGEEKQKNIKEDNTTPNTSTQQYTSPNVKNFFDQFNALMMPYLKKIQTDQEKDELLKDFIKTVGIPLDQQVDVLKTESTKIKFGELKQQLLKK